jgi:hypothetical protein
VDTGPGKHETTVSSAAVIYGPGNFFIDTYCARRGNKSLLPTRGH